MANLCADDEKSSLSSSLSYRDNANLILPFSVDPLAANRDEQLQQVAIRICPFFQKRPLVVKPLLGGLSNELFIVSDPSSSSSPSSVLVRIYPGDDGWVETRPRSVHVVKSILVNRELENRLVAWLSQHHMAPIFYGRFQNGRVEELYPNVSPLSAKEMVPYGPKIAKALADFHSLDVPASVLAKPPSTDGKVPARFEAVDLWVRTIQDADSPHADLLQLLSKEWKWLRAQLLTEPPTNTTSSGVQAKKALQFIRQVVLTHMDAQSLNILKDHQATNGEGEIRLIDFEYSGWNHRAADLANTFCEHCDMNNICADYPAEYPSDRVQNIFLKTYIERCCQPLWIVNESDDWDEILATMRSEIGRFTLLSHLGWAAWSVLMVNEGSTIDFDYIAYAKHRMDGYEFGKKRFFAEEL